jgi:hypothetical protein
MRTAVAIAVVALTVVSLAAGTPPTGSDDPRPRFTISTRKADDTVEVTGDADRTAFDVRSPSGIGRAVVDRTGDAWPKVVVVRLHLKGLETLKVSNGTVAVGAAAGVRDGKVEVRQWTGDKDETPPAADDPLRLTIRALDTAGKPAAGLPLDGGHFEVTLPAAFFRETPKALTVEWIDFYR